MTNWTAPSALEGFSVGGLEAHHAQQNTAVADALEADHPGKEVVGLIAHYAARSLTLGHPGRELVPSAVIGALLLLLADLVVRLAPAGRTIPVGVAIAS